MEGRVAVLAKTPEEFSSHLPPLRLDVALDGIVLYDPEGYATDRLTQLRELIRRCGLIRERTGRDLVGVGSTFPVSTGRCNGNTYHDRPGAGAVSSQGREKFSAEFNAYNSCRDFGP